MDREVVTAAAGTAGSTTSAERATRSPAEDGATTAASFPGVVGVHVRSSR